MRNLVRLVVLLAAASLPAAAQQYAYPAKGQTPQKQKADEAECNTWAKQQSGFDPSKPPPAAAPTEPAPVTGSGARARGAAGGAAIGAIAGGDKSDAAVAGAVIGASRQRRENRQAAAQQDQAAQQQVQAGHGAFQKARAACLEGRGYTVK